MKATPKPMKYTCGWKSAGTNEAMKPDTAGDGANRRGKTEPTSQMLLQAKPVVAAMRYENASGLAKGNTQSSAAEPTAMRSSTNEAADGRCIELLTRFRHA